ncbi:HU family DNA-binding protein [Mesoplasma seiffertii]|uniref:HU family DNA-binding protein n=1 Tax=Mesoplasma seiffertii TaxID=28224 RepID=UPI0004B342A8|nr:HU family DNA-binding protein [Mesoplasma seiffertii]
MFIRKKELKNQLEKLTHENEKLSDTNKKMVSHNQKVEKEIKTLKQDIADILTLIKSLHGEVEESVSTPEPVIEKTVEITQPKAPRAPKIKREQVSKKMILEDLIANYSDMSKKRVKQIVDDVFATLQNKLEASEEITLAGFGKLQTITKPAKVSRNPLTGEKINIPEQIGVKFKPSKTLKEKMN